MLKMGTLLARLSFNNCVDIARIITPHAPWIQNACSTGRLLRRIHVSFFSNGDLEGALSVLEDPLVTAMSYINVRRN